MPAKNSLLVADSTAVEDAFSSKMAVVRSGQSDGTSAAAGRQSLSPEMHRTPALVTTPGGSKPLEFRRNNHAPLQGHVTELTKSV